MRLTFFLLLCLLGSVPAMVADGALAFKLGSFFPGGESGFWQRNLEAFDFEVRDFNAVMGGVELGIEISDYLDVAVGFDGYSRQVGSRYRDLVRVDGSDIVRDFELKVFPITGGLRFLPLLKFGRFLPVLSAGLGLYYYDYQEQGDFVDLETSVIKPNDSRDRGLVPGGYIGAGLEVLIFEGIDRGQGWYGFADFRRHWAAAKLSMDEVDNEPANLDLGGIQVAFGLTLRF